MKNHLRFLAAAIVSAAILLAIAWASIAPLRVARGDDAIVRISLGARPERIEVCRRQTDEELAKLAPQMRQRVVCEGTTARYRLDIRRNGELLHSQVVRGGGLRNDRPLYVSHDLRVPAGPALFAVHLSRIDTISAEQRESSLEDEDDDEDEEGHVEGRGAPRPGDQPPARARRESEERHRRRGESIPADLRLDLSVTLDPREVMLVSYDQRNRRLISVSGDSSGRD
jgi:hypothetical protein